MQGFCIYKNGIGSCIYDLINICVHFIQFVHCLYVQTKQKDPFSQLVVQVFHSLYIVCINKIHAFRFQDVFSLNFVQVLYSLYIFCMYVIVCTFPPNLLLGVVGAWILLSNFQKKGGGGGAWQDLSFQRGLLGKIGVLSGGVHFQTKNKLKPGMFNDKKVYKQECFALS